jgi:hypothetical protein
MKFEKMRILDEETTIRNQLINIKTLVNVKKPCISTRL